MSRSGPGPGGGACSRWVSAERGQKQRQPRAWPPPSSPCGVTLPLTHPHYRRLSPAPVAAAIFTDEDMEAQAGEK